MARVQSEAPADEVSQLQGFPSCPVALHQLSITSSWLSITSLGSPSHPMALHHIPCVSIMLPCLSSMYLSRPAPLLYHTPPTSTPSPTSPRSSRCLCCSQAPGRLVGLPGHLPALCSWPRFGWWLLLLQACSLLWVPPPALTHPCAGHPCCSDARDSLPQPPALQYSPDHFNFSSHHPMVSHGQMWGSSVFRWAHGLLQWKRVRIAQDLQ